MNTSRVSLPGSYEDLLNRARLALRSDDIQGSVALYRRLVEKLNRLSARVLERRPDLRDLHRQARLELASVLEADLRLAEAIEVVRVLLQSHPGESDRWRTDLARLRIAKGEVEMGLADLRLLAEEAPGDPWRWIVLANEARLEGRFAESQAALDRLLAESSGDEPEVMAGFHFQRFRLFKALGRLDDAAAAWEEALALDAKIGDTVRQVYTMFADAGRFGEAKRYVGRDKNALQAGYQRGIIASRTGDPAEARREWQAVADLNPDAFEYGHDAWVESVLRLGDPVPALEWLQNGLSKFGTPRLLILSGIGWAMHKDGEVAGALFQQAINVLRRNRPPKQKLDGADWRLLDSLVADDGMKQELKSYFAVVETVWG